MKRRFWELDFLRGVAIVAMIFYHLFFILNFYEIYKVNLYSDVVSFFAWWVRFIFLALVGVGMVISYYRILGKGGGRWRAILRQWNRSLVVLVCAMLVTGATYFVVPGDFVRFGILHLIVVSIFFWSFFVEWKWAVLGMALVSFWLGGWFEWMGITGVDLAKIGADGVAMSVLKIGNFNAAYFLRDMNWSVQAVDYFPILPWIGIVGIGIFLGNIFYPKGEARFEWKAECKSGRVIGSVGARVAGDVSGRVIKILNFLGRHSLLIYMVHVPMIMAVLWAVGLVKF